MHNISKIFKALTIAALVLLGHILLLLHITFCSSHTSADNIISLDLSIMPYINPMPAPQQGGDLVEHKIVNQVNNGVQKIASAAKKQVKSKVYDDIRGANKAQSNVLPVVANPKFINYVPPIYPAAAKRRRQEGTVVLDINVAANGMQSGISIVNSSGFALLDNAALKSAEQSRYDNMTSQGQAGAPYIARMRYDFVLKR